MRKLAHVEEIAWVKPINGADNIELVGVLGWQCITKKGEFQPGELCVYIEIDSIVDRENPDFAFLEAKKYRIKTMKLNKFGVISQGICFPMQILPNNRKFSVGDDVTEILHIKHVEEYGENLPKNVNKRLVLKQRHKRLSNNKIFKWFMKFGWFRAIAFKLLIPKRKPKKFPDWIVRTDETRIQNMPCVLETYKDEPMVVTEKLDGTSTTFGLRREGRKLDFAVCSRNVRQETPKQKTYMWEENIYWQIERKYNIKPVLEKIMKDYDADTVVLQGETIGKDIQGNKYKLQGIDFYGFNLILDGDKVDSVAAAEIMKEYGIKWVPILEADFKLLPTVDDMVKYATAKSTIGDTLREGVVIRDHRNTVSFKCISNEFLLKYNI